HYSTQLNFTFDGLSSARKARLRVQNYIYELFENKNETGSEPDIERLRDLVFGELANDLQAPKAIANLFEFLNEHPANNLSKYAARRLLKFFEELNKIFNVWKIEPKPIETIQIPEDVIHLAEKRYNARKEKDYKMADKLREEILAKGYIIIDTKDGYELKPNEKN
ncbi:MAG: hypothetical protein ACK4SO_03635, partial [Candidatus Kapaibacteriota bacterium]